MRKKPLYTGLILAALCGCAAPRGDIVVRKTTVFGMEISYDAGNTSPHVRLGLVRHLDMLIPTSTNRIYAPDYTTRMEAEIKPLSQSATESFGFGAGATPVRTNSPNLGLAP